MEPLEGTRRIVVVGGAGALGSRFVEWFRGSGDLVHVVDPAAPAGSPAHPPASTGPSSRDADAFAAADLVLVAVPINVTCEVIAHLPPLRPDAVLADLTSVKAPAVEAMLAAHPGSVAGLHPMFGPDVAGPAGEVVVHSPGRGDVDWVIDRIAGWGCRVEQVEAAEHDRLMGIIQALRHTVTVAYGVDLRREGADLDTLLALSSPIYRTELMMVGRLFAQDPELYHDIITASPANLELLEHFHRTLGDLVAGLRAGDREGFVAEFEAVREYFAGHSEEFLAESRELLAAGKALRAASAEEAAETLGSRAVQELQGLDVGGVGTPDAADDLAAKLAPHRAEIDRIDRELLRLVNARAAQARAIGTLKGTAAAYRPEREAQVLRGLVERNPGPLPDDAVRRVFRELMSECLAVERPLTVSYLGPAGTFTEQAARRHFGGAAMTVPAASLEEVLREVEARQADYAVVPVENSTEGAVGRALDLISRSPLEAVGEVRLRIVHHLMGRGAGAGSGAGGAVAGGSGAAAGAGGSGVRRVFAHSQALAQCQDFLTRHLPDAERVPVSSNAEAARLVAELAAQGVTDCAALGPSGAAELYGLDVWRSGVEDDPENTTRFLVLGHESPPASGHDRTSLVVSPPKTDRDGALLAMLRPLAAHGVSMTKLESRPMRGVLWQYLFFIEVDGHASDPAVASALAELRDSAVFFKLVGSYPRVD
ncbi:bifunctional chorismate mutase/prephenate dehydrogenase [Kytococcus sedentarius]|uniref:bifunctional chorismate mutase/prephenate dehydrogenase n=1 Tax=Kytococcus sedentarius TaxID=1276 RepID=UPI0035BC5870